MPVRQARGIKLCEGLRPIVGLKMLCGPTGKYIAN